MDRFRNEVPEIGISLTNRDTLVAVDWGVGRIRAHEAGATTIVFRAGDITDSIPVQVPAFTKLFVIYDSDCGISTNKKAICWSRGSAWDHGAVQGASDVVEAAFGSASCLLSDYSAGSRRRVVCTAST
ncbi:MAG: hypothetical protein ABI877_15530, partial [Gemmatimonadaceae bacterium]